MIVRRLRKSDRSSLHSTTSDWTFLSMLWIAGVTGFFLELGLYLPSAPSWGYPMFLVHVGVAMALVLLVPLASSPTFSIGRSRSSPSGCVVDTLQEPSL